MSEQLKEKPTEVYVEIGYGISPSALYGDRKYEDGRVYLGIDSAQGDYTHDGKGTYGEQVRQNAAQFQRQAKADRPSESINFLLGDGKHLPLPDNSVHEVYMANVLTAPMRPSHRKALLNEISRALQPNGELVIKVNWDVWMWPEKEKEVERLVSNSGLDVLGYVSSETNEDDYAELELQYGITRGAEQAPGYYVIAQKPAELENV